MVLLKLATAPVQIAALDLLGIEETPVVSSDLCAVGHPHGYKHVVTNGKVTAMPRTRDLPLEVQDGFLKEFLGDTPDNLWIQHNAEIFPGNSGGPLLNVSGQVVGVNTWIDRQVNAAFAIHSDHIHRLMANRFDDPAPLRSVRRVDVPTLDSGNPFRDMIAKALSRIPQPGELTLAMTEAQDAGWTPGSVEAYRPYRVLARQFLGALLGPEERQRELREVVKTMTNTAWGEQQIGAMNRATLDLLPPLDSPKLLTPYFMICHCTVEPGGSDTIFPGNYFAGTIVRVTGTDNVLSVMKFFPQQSLNVPEGFTCWLIGVTLPTSGTDGTRQFHGVFGHLLPTSEEIP